MHKGLIYVPIDYCDSGLFQPSISIHKDVVCLAFKADETI
jgi:hypothetical protein